MKNKAVWLFIFLFVVLMHNASATDGFEFGEKRKFPSACRMFLLKHFPETEIAHIELETGFFQLKCFHVILTNGIDIHFKQSNGKWIQIKGNPGTIPEQIFPDHLTQYLEKFYPNRQVVIATLESDLFLIKLNDDTELTFDCNGNPIKNDF